MKERKKTIIRSVLEEELERNERVIKRYELELSKLPKGSIIKRTIGKKDYYYLAYREEKKVITKYIGKANETEITDLKKQLDKRKHIVEVIKNLKQEEMEIKRALR